MHCKNHYYFANTNIRHIIVEKNDYVRGRYIDQKAVIIPRRLVSASYQDQWGVHGAEAGSNRR